MNTFKKCSDLFIIDLWTIICTVNTWEKAKVILQIDESQEVKEGLLQIQNLLCLQHQTHLILQSHSVIVNKTEYFHFTFHHVYVYVQIWLGDPWHNDMHGPLLTQEWRMRMQAMENWPECHCLRLETLRSPACHCQSLQPQGFIE